MLEFREGQNWTGPSIMKYSMKSVCVLWLWMFWSECKTTTDGISVQGYAGKNIIITCSHSWASNNMKYFCRDPCKENVLVTSDQSPKGRFALKDYGTGTFTVNITDPQESDSGIYWCGVKRSVVDTYEEVKLTVCKEQPDITGDQDEATPATEKSPETNVEKHPTAPTPSLPESPATTESTVFTTGFVAESGNRTAGKKTAPVSYMSYASAGLAVLVIACAVALTAVCLCRTTGEKSRGVTANPAHTEHPDEEASGVYANTSYESPYATIRKCSQKSTDNSQSDGLYQNLLIDTLGNPVYDNLY